MFFDTEAPHSWTFHHGAPKQNIDGQMEEPCPRPVRPKFHSFDALRPGLFSPRPFQQHQQQRERRASDGSGCYTSEEDGHGSDARSQASSTGSCGEPESRPMLAKERIIPIMIEQEDEEGGKVAEEPPQRPLRKHSKRDTTDGGVPMMRDIDEEVEEKRSQNGGDGEVNGAEEDGERDLRAQSCPVSVQLPPLNVSAAMSSQQRSASQPPQPPAYGKPNYLNSSPKPFSPGAKPYQPASFAGFRPVSLRRPSQQHEQKDHDSVNIPIQIERSTTTNSTASDAGRNSTGSLPRPPPKVAPKPSTSFAPPAQTPRQMALGKIVAVHQEVDPLAAQLATFSGVRGDKEYLYLDEMLTRQLIRLDDVEANGDVDVRNSRKEAIKRIQDSLAILEKKCSENGHTDTKKGNTNSDVPAEASGVKDEEKKPEGQTSSGVGMSTEGLLPKESASTNNISNKTESDQSASELNADVTGKTSVTAENGQVKATADGGEEKGETAGAESR